MKNKKMMPLLLGLVLLASSCAPTAATPDENAISTAAAQTVEARFTQMADPPPVSTPTKKPASTATSLPAPAPTPTKGTGYTAPPEGCLQASLISETVPDGTVFSPGEYFWKYWYVQNTGTCTWDSSYKLVFMSGDILGGAAIYDFPGGANPDETVEIPVQFLAPAQNGSYRGYWKIQSPSGYIFGVGNDQSFWVDISVSDNPDYRVTSVQYTISREPATGCPVNVWYTTYATITVNGPTTVEYEWQLSNGKAPEKPAKPIEFTAAGTKKVSHVWQLHSGSVIKDRWVWINVYAPNNQEYQNNLAHIVYDCN